MLVRLGAIALCPGCRLVVDFAVRTRGDLIFSPDRPPSVGDPLCAEAGAAGASPTVEAFAGAALAPEVAVEELAAMTLAEQVAAVGALPAAEGAAVLALLPPEAAATVLAELPSAVASALLQAMDPDAAGALVVSAPRPLHLPESVCADDASPPLGSQERLPPDVAARLLALMPEPADAAAIVENVAPAAAAPVLAELGDEEAAELLAAMAPATAVPVLAALPPPAAADLAAMMPPEKAAAIVAAMAPPAAAEVLAEMGPREAAAIAGEMDVDAALPALLAVPPAARDAILNELDPAALAALLARLVARETDVDATVTRQCLSAVQASATACPGVAAGAGDRPACCAELAALNAGECLCLPEVSAARLRPDSRSAEPKADPDARAPRSRRSSTRSASSAASWWSSRRRTARRTARSCSGRRAPPSRPWRPSSRASRLPPPRPRCRTSAPAPPPPSSR